LTNLFLFLRRSDAPAVHRIDGAVSKRIAASNPTVFDTRTVQLIAGRFRFRGPMNVHLVAVQANWKTLQLSK